VILAAVIAAFVFGMAGNINKTKIVAATASQQGTTVWVTYQGGQDSADVTDVTCKVDDQASVSIGTSVGATTAFTVNAGSEKNHVTATATFIDGTTQVILDTYV
jgi:FlaG/FlaF family flagellin (archaellin)